MVQPKDSQRGQLVPVDAPQADGLGELFETLDGQGGLLALLASHPQLQLYVVKRQDVLETAEALLFLVQLVEARRRDQKGIGVEVLV